MKRPSQSTGIRGHSYSLSKVVDCPEQVFRGLWACKVMPRLVGSGLKGSQN